MLGGCLPVSRHLGLTPSSVRLSGQRPGRRHSALTSCLSLLRARGFICHRPCRIAATIYLASASFIRLMAMSFWPALRSFFVAWYLPRALVSMATLGALPQIHGCLRTSAAVIRFLGSTVSIRRTRSLALSEILSHQGEGKSYLQGRSKRRR